MTELRSHDSEMWRLDKEDIPFMEAILVASGVDLDAPSIDIALAHVRPMTLTEGALAYLSEEERAVYDFEQAQLKKAGYEPLPPFKMP